MPTLCISKDTDMLLTMHLFIVLFVHVYVAFQVGFPHRGANVVFSIDYAGAVRWQHIRLAHDTYRRIHEGVLVQSQ